MDRQTEITVSDGDAEVARKTVPPGEYVIGREPGCDLCVDLETVSGRHAKLILRGEGALVEDLGSDSGTFVGGNRVVGTATIQPGEQIQIGSAALQLRPLALPAEPGSPDGSVTLAPATGALAETCFFSRGAEGAGQAGGCDPTMSLPPGSAPDLSRGAFLAAVRRGRRYEVGRVVARGGMGAILDAKESPIGRTVAMKVMLDADSPEGLARFLAEAKVTGQLEHPNIVPVHELGVDEKQQVFYTMKFVRGMTLRKVLQDIAAGDAETVANYPLAQLLTIFQKICDAMAFAHSKGVIHRDLKPENVMLGDYGEVLVMDWGLAKVIGQTEETTEPGRSSSGVPGTSSAQPISEAATMAGAILGTLRYMPPEQAKGQIELLDARSDVYSLGAILYHILTLKPSVEGNSTAAVLIKVCSGEIVPSAEHTKGDRRLPHLPGGRVPESLSAVAMKAMAVEQQDRYQSVLELQRDVQAYQNGFATSAEHASLAKQLVLLVRRHKAVFGTVFAAALLVVVLTAGFIIKVTASERAAKRAEAQAIKEEESARRALAKSQIALAEAAFREQDGPGMQTVLGSVPDDLRDSNWNYLWQRSDTSLATLRRPHDKWIMCAVPDPTRPGVFAITGADSWVWLVEVRTGSTLLEFQTAFSEKTGRVSVLAISPDGQRLAVGRQGRSVNPSADEIVIHSLRDGKKLAAWNAAYTKSLQFSPDGGQLLEATYSNAINVWDSTSGRLMWSQPSRTPAAVFDPRGEYVLAAFPWTLKLLNAKDGSLVRQFPSARKYWANCLAIAPDGERAYLGQSDGGVFCLDLKNGQIVFEIRANEKGLAALAYVRDGNRLVTMANLSGERRSVQVWDAASGKFLQSLLGGGGTGRGLSVHPLSGELVVSGAAAKAWNLASRPEKWLFHTGTGGRSLAFWKTDDWIFAEGRSAGIELLDLQCPDPLKRPLWTPAEKKDWSSVKVSADGRFAVVGESPDKNTACLLRLNGRKVEMVRTFQVAPFLGPMALSPTGDRVWTWNCVLDSATGSRLLPLDRRSDKQEMHEGLARWLNATQVVEAVTAKNGRGLRGTEEQLILWDAATGRQLKTVVNRNPVLALAVAFDGCLIAEAGADKMVRLRDPATLEVQEEFRAHDGPITAIAFHPHRPILATASDDLTVRLWNLDTGRLLEELRGLIAPPWDLSFSPSGRRLACLSSDQTTWIWEIEASEPSTARK
jgi:serine/threonine protein kinase